MAELIASESALPLAFSLVERAWELKDRLYQPFLPLAAHSRTPQPNPSCNT